MTGAGSWREPVRREVRVSRETACCQGVEVDESRIKEEELGMISHIERI